MKLRFFIIYLLAVGFTAFEIAVSFGVANLFHIEWWMALIALQIFEKNRKEIDKGDYS